MTQQEQIGWWRTTFGDEEVKILAESVAQERISQGAVTEKLESRFAEALDVPYVVATQTGSAALALAMMALGIGRDDEVIVPDRTWIATAHAAVMVGARVVLVDTLEDIPIINVSQIQNAITPRTKAILPVHLNGRSADMAGIRSIAEEHGLLVIEDACQALFSKNADGFLGTQSDAGCFSLGVTKLISTGQGGIVVTRNEETYENLKLVRNHGVVDNFTDTWNRMGFNFKFTDLLASFGLAQLYRVPGRLSHLQTVYATYGSAIAEMDDPLLRLIPVDVSGGEVPLYIEALCSERDELVGFLNAQGIQARPFPPSLHTSEYLGNTGDFPRSRVFADQGMYLPCGPEQPLENVERVISALIRYRDDIQRETTARGAQP
jgi:perosamine synthetase